MRRTCAAVILMMLFVLVSALFAEEQANTEAIAPRLIKFSGALKDASGFPRHGDVVMTFALYGSHEGGKTKLGHGLAGVKSRTASIRVNFKWVRASARTYLR